ncbi:MAG TPA: MBL fold metallo-hydrolase [Chloroflexota bacterium]
MTEERRLRDGLYLIDLRFQGEPEVIAAYLLESAGEYALVEVGPTTTLDALLDGVRAAGVAPESISRLLVTHIHLDHAGAAGALIRRYPSMQLYVHELGASHMADPSKLLRSAERIYGDQMGPLWGEVVPVPDSNITTVSDGDVVDIGDTRLTVHYTPGHASHHVAYRDAGHGDVFTGDVAAIRLPGFDYVRPATPPPDIDLDLWSASLDTLEALQPSTIYLTHYGPFRDVDAHIARTRAQLFAWADYVEDLATRGEDAAAIKAELIHRAEEEVRAAHDDPEAVRRYELAAPAGMSVDGYLRYFKQRAAASR